MYKFEAIGVERQMECSSKQEAVKVFRHSCEICCYHGMRIDCDKCAIAHAHREVLAALNEGQKLTAATIDAEIERFFA